MSAASLETLEKTLRDEDAQWAAEQKDPTLRTQRLRREYRADQRSTASLLVGVWIVGGALLAWGAIEPSIWRRWTAGRIDPFVGTLLIGLVLAVATVLGALALDRRRRDYRAAVAGAPPARTTGEVGPRP